MAKQEHLEPIHPGEILLEDFMKPMGISINGWLVTSPYRQGASATS